MNMPGEQLLIANDPAHVLASGLLWRISEGASTWKGDRLSTTRRDAPMPFKAAAFAPSAGDQSFTVPAEGRFVVVEP